MIAALIAVVSPRARGDAYHALGEAYRAYDAGDLAGARAKLAMLDEQRLAIRDYALWLRGMVALRGGEPGRAEAWFHKLAQFPASPLAREVSWRLADCAWDRGERKAAALAYQKVLAAKDALEVGDVGTAMFRIAETRTGTAALAQYRALVVEHPADPLAIRAEQKLAALGAPALTAKERIERAKYLTDAHLWDEAVAELSLIGDSIPADVAHQRDYWLGITLFKMRRRYGDAGKLLLKVYPELGDSAAGALFHGARALSRADRDDEAIRWYQEVVARYPNTL
jgi:tetratricopeptide (TPR) repeat protein